MPSQTHDGTDRREIVNIGPRHGVSAWIKQAERQSNKGFQNVVEATRAVFVPGAKHLRPASLISAIQNIERALDATNAVAVSQAKVRLPGGQWERSISGFTPEGVRLGVRNDEKSYAEENIVLNRTVFQASPRHAETYLHSGYLAFTRHMIERIWERDQCTSRTLPKIFGDHAERILHYAGFALYNDIRLPGLVPQIAVPFSDGLAILQMRIWATPEFRQPFGLKRSIYQCEESLPGIEHFEDRGFPPGYTPVYTAVTYMSANTLALSKHEYRAAFLRAYEHAKGTHWSNMWGEFFSFPLLPAQPDFEPSRLAKAHIAEAKTLAKEHFRGEDLIKLGIPFPHNIPHQIADKMAKGLLTDEEMQLIISQQL